MVPFRLKVAHRLTEVRPMSAEGAMLGECKGVWEDTSGVIYINTGYQCGEQVATLIHEIIHAVYSCFSLGVASRTEEQVCCGLDVPLATVFLDNPDLCSRMTDTLMGRRGLFDEPPRKRS
jgi:hypothetical protein